MNTVLRWNLSTLDGRFLGARLDLCSAFSRCQALLATEPSARFVLRLAGGRRR